MRSNRAALAHATTVWVLLSLALPASAQDYAREGFYLGVGILGGVYTKFDDETEDQLRSAGLPVDVDTDAAVGVELYGGYRLSPHFSLEAEFETFPEADVNVSGLGKVAELESWTLTGNAKTFPFTGRVQPFLLMGLGLMSAELDVTTFVGGDDSETGFAARFGGGLDYYFTRHIVVSAGVDYLLPTGDVDDLDYVSFGVGAQFRF